jgi:hypothetical protein
MSIEQQLAADLSSRPAQVVATLALIQQGGFHLPAGGRPSQAADRYGCN